jgi:hypothetical protein
MEEGTHGDWEVVEIASESAGRTISRSPCDRSSQEQSSLEALKVECLALGVRISEPELRSLGGSAALTVHEYSTTGGMTFRVGGDLYINAPFDDWFCCRSTVDFVMTPAGYAVRHRGRTFPLDEVLPLPGYLGLVDHDGFRADSMAMSHVDRIRLSPLVGCAFDCHFCDLASERYVRRHPAELVRALTIASQDKVLPARHVLISGGTPGPRHREWFEESCLAITKHAATLGLDVDVMMSPHEGSVPMIRRMVDAGVAGFALNLELSGSPAGAIYIRGKRRLSWPYYDNAVSEAVKLLGSQGAVRSLIIAGLEPAEATLAGIDHIASLGADPVISPFRPARRTKLSNHEPPSPEMLTYILGEARLSAHKAGVALGPRCVPCQHNTLTFPWDR